MIWQHIANRDENKGYMDECLSLCVFLRLCDNCYQIALYNPTKLSGGHSNNGDRKVVMFTFPIPPQCFFQVGCTDNSALPFFFFLLCTYSNSFQY